MNIYYLNHLNEKLELDSKNIILQYQELFNYSWDVNTDNNKISSFSRETATIPITVTVTADTEEEHVDILHNFHNIIETDIISRLPGRLYIGDQYLTCYISGDIKQDAFMGVPIQVKNLTIVTDKPFWIKEESRSFQPLSGSADLDTYLDYEHDYDYDYSTPYGRDTIWYVDHYAPCEFEMIVYGPCVDPRVVINGHIYQVYATLNGNDYLKINSLENSVVQYLSNGTQRDLYDYRSKTNSIFEPITPGNVRVVWSGEFGFDLTLYCERSEPRWKT